MSALRPFRGWRPPSELAQQVAAPPYDVVSTEEARALSRGNEQSFLHVSRPEIDLPPGTDEHAGEVYRKGTENLRRFIEHGWLRQDPEPLFYAYRQTMGAYTQLGLVAGASVEEYDQGLIKKHELTRADKEDDRTRHLDALGGNDEPVFLTYRATRPLDALMAEVIRAAPEYDFRAEDGIAHTFWLVPPALGTRIAAEMAKVPQLYVADGHHRSAAASRVRKLRRGKGSGEQDWFLAVVFPHDQLRILPYNRVVKDLGGLSPERLRSALEEKFTLEPSGEKSPRELHQLCMYLGGQWYRLTARPGSYLRTPIGELDVSILQEGVLGPLLGIGDPRTDQRIQFVGGIRGTGELERLVDSGQHQVAFSMFPTTVDQLLAIADAGEIMPPKSTWFEPKLRSGLVLHLFE